MIVERGMMMRTLLAMPCMETVYTDFFIRTLGMHRFEGDESTATKGSLVYDARNLLANKAIDEGFDRVMWLDSDMIFDPDLEHRLAARLDEGYDIVSGLYFTRRLPLRPVIYKELYVEGQPDGSLKPISVSYDDYPENSVFEIAACGFGAVMMTVDALKRVRDHYGLPFSPAIGFGEDLSFCMRAKELGIKMHCDSSIKLEHIMIGTSSERDYLLTRGGE